mmetsp:Transcript_36715/g.44887  ORF Transcript_36715/g.44887 Transcript_36715/m.44887 type:complete len:81 (+) Transcript_36715:461-703(+)
MLPLNVDDYELMRNVAWNDVQSEGCLIVKCYPEGSGCSSDPDISCLVTVETSATTCFISGGNSVYRYCDEEGSPGIFLQA